MGTTERSESEWQTRKQRIDKGLRDAGWSIVQQGAVRPVQFYQHHALEEYETANGPADYALCADGKVLGIVEAKKVTLGPQNVLSQAERYSRGVTDSPSTSRACAFRSSTRRTAR
jgi:type I restriction enzyme R subunit